MPPPSILRWLDTIISTVTLENYLANRLLYPQTIPTTAQEMKIDLALLKEGIYTNAKVFYNSSLNKITIPAGFEERFKPLSSLIECFIDGLGLTQDTNLLIQGITGEERQGQILIPSPSKIPPRSNHIILTSKIIDGQLTPAPQFGPEINLPGNRLVIVPLPTNHLFDIKIDNLSYAKLQVGTLGLIIDFRSKTPPPL